MQFKAKSYTNKYNCRCEASRGKPHAQKCLKAIVQEGHNICTSKWQMLSAILKTYTV